MCLGTIQLLEEAWEEAGTRLGRLEDGVVVSLAFVPDAEPGRHVLVHMGVPVEVLDADAAEEALALREGARR
jgi:hydrogenase maturation factor